MKAIQIDAGRPEPHNWRRSINSEIWDRRAARIEFRRAIDLNPGLSEAHFYSVFLLQTGLLGQAQDEIKRAHELDPLNPWRCHRLCVALLLPGPRNLAGLRGGARLHGAVFRKARASLGAGCLAGEGGGGRRGLPFVLGLLGRAYALNGQVEKALEIQLKLQELSEKRYTSQVARALVSLGLGELDRALHWLEEALQAHDAFLCCAKVFAPYDPIRAHPPFHDMLRRMGVADPVSSETAAAP